MYIISADKSLFKFDFKELLRYRDLIIMLVRRDFVTFYKQTILGPLWFVIQPLLTMLIYIILFGNIAKLSTDGLPQTLFYLSGITIWNYFSESLNKTSTVFRDNVALLGKVYFPRLVMPLSIVLSNLMKFLVQFILFIALVFYYWYKGVISPTVWAISTPILILLMALLALGLGMIFTSLTTKYRDLVFVITFGIQLLMYVTPVVYPSSAVPKNYEWIIHLNPLTFIFESFRYAFLGVGSISLQSSLMSVMFIFAIFFIGLVIFNKTQRSFIDTI